jgi:hypothetical protein
VKKVEVWKSWKLLSKVAENRRKAPDEAPVDENHHDVSRDYFNGTNIDLSQFNKQKEKKKNQNPPK